MQSLTNEQTADTYTDACTLEDEAESNGGSASIVDADVYVRLQYGTLGAFFWTDEVHVPAGTLVLDRGTTGVQFRSFVPGVPANVSASLATAVEPPIQLAAGGQSGVSTSAFTVLNIKTFGAKVDGVFDDSGAWNRAEQEAESLGGGIVYCPTGTSYCASSVGIGRSGIRIMGNGIRSTTVLFKDSVNGFAINGVGVDIYGVGISDLTIQYQNPTAGVVAIRVVTVGFCLCERVELRNVWHGISVGATGATFGANVVFRDIYGTTKGVGVQVVDQVNGIWLEQVNLAYTNVGGGSSAVMLPNGASSGNLDTLYATDCLFQQYDFGLLCQATNVSPSVVQNVFMNRCIFDQCGQYGLFANAANGGKIATWKLTDCWFTGLAQDAVLIQGNVDGVELTRPRITAAHNRGILVTGSAINIDIDEPKIAGVSTAGAGLFSCIYFTSTCSKFRVRGGVCGTYGYQPAALSNYGITIENGCTDFVIEGVNVEGNTVGGINDLTTSGAKRFIRNNPGYNPVGIVAAPAVPASGVAQTNNFSKRVTVYVTANAVGATSVAVNGTNVVPALAVSQSVPIDLDPGETLTVTYANAPTWVWYAD